VVDDGALYEALTNGKLRAAGIDVWYNYPTDEASRTNTQPADAPLHTLDNVVLSPHRGGMTEDTHVLRLDALAQMLNEAAAGRPLPNQIDLERGY
jgi:phosphoglycerate dehydrogenase-like enzyme